MGMGQLNTERSQTYVALNEKSLAFYKKFNKHFLNVDCPFCNSNSNRYCYEVNKYKVVQCKNCLSFFINPRPTPDLIDIYFKRFYSEPFYNLRSNEKKTDDFRNGHINKANTIYGYINDFIHEFGRLRILDVGCSCGFTLHCLKEIMKDVESEFIGIDLYVPEADIANDVKLLETNIDDYLTLYGDERKFDVILIIGLLEAIYDCRAFIQCAKKLLNKNGFIYITTPNINSIPMILDPNSFYSTRAHSLNPPYGINAFNPANMIVFAQTNDLTVEKLTTPGKLDLDILEKCEIGENTLNEQLINNFVDILSKCSKKEKGLLQELLNTMLISSHMEVILRKT